MKRNKRVTVTVDARLVEAANQAGRADSLSAWVDVALVEREAKEQRLLALADAVPEYEAARPHRAQCGKIGQSCCTGDYRATGACAQGTGAVDDGTPRPRARARVRCAHRHRHRHRHTGYRHRSTRDPKTGEVLESSFNPR